MTKKEKILKTAARLFAEQGFDGTTTLQIAGEAGVTEPLIYYHFKGKDELFASILESAFASYHRRLESLGFDSESQFQNIRNLILIHFDFIDQKPHEAFLIVSTCPARANDPKDVCGGIYTTLRTNLLEFVTQCLLTGIERGEFRDVPVAETAHLLVALIYGLLRQRALGLENFNALRATTVEFCRRSLVMPSDD
jgi:AcrR family transcriptional regulator